jgi:endonuclease IV
MALIIGKHVHKKDKLYENSILNAIKEANENGIDINIFQIFVRGPMNRKLLFDADEIETIKNMKLNIIVHGAYVSNLFYKNEKSSFSLYNKEIEIATQLNANGIICHLCNNTNEFIVNKLKRFVELYEPKTRIYLETVPDGDNSISNINNLFALLKQNNILHHFGICIDTAHLWASGIDSHAYISKIKVTHKIIHFNDDLNDFNSKKDMHVSIGYGQIWENNDKYKSIISYAKSHKIPLILERKSIIYTNCDVKLDYNLIYKLTNNIDK